MNPKPLKERIRAQFLIIAYKRDSFCNGTISNKEYQESLDQALQAILTEIKKNLPEHKIAPSGSLEDKYGYLAGQRKGWNAYHDEVEKLL